MSKPDPASRIKRAYSMTTQLKNIGPKSNAQYKFILESSPFDEDDCSPPTGDWVITGRVLPHSDIYKSGSLRIEMVLGPEYPFVAPKVYIRSPVFHPNVDKNGEICFDLLSNRTSWQPTSTFVSIITEVIKIIDEPIIDHVKHPEAATLYDTNKPEYERVAVELFKKNYLPRE